MRTAAIDIEPGQYLSAWKSEARTLFVPVLSEARPGEAAAVRVGIQGHPIRATVFGKVSSVRRVGRPSLPPGVELALDPASLAAAGFLAAAARGEPVSFRERDPRWVVEWTLEVIHGGARFDVRTANVSAGGAALVWEGLPPEPGSTVELRLGGRWFPALADAVVCWSAAGRSESALGVRVLARGRGARAWRNVTREAERVSVRTV